MAIFLRNHDELTLETVTDRERIISGSLRCGPARAAQSRNTQELAPLSRTTAADIELMNSLLLTMPGTAHPSDYGDESRMATTSIWATATACARPCNGRRTAMAAQPRRSVIARAATDHGSPLWGYQAVNVEAQWRNPHSLLNCYAACCSSAGATRRSGAAA